MSYLTKLENNKEPHTGKINIAHPEAFRAYFTGEEQFKLIEAYRDEFKTTVEFRNKKGVLVGYIVGKMHILNIQGDVEYWLYFSNQYKTDLKISDLRTIISTAFKKIEEVLKSKYEIAKLVKTLAS